VIDTLAWCLCLNGQAAEAKPLIGQALKRKTQDAAIFFHAAMIHQALKEEGTARKLFAKALNLNPNFQPTQAAKAVEMLAVPVKAAEPAIPAAATATSRIAP
jgi:tetratricopeptide (TPR) repeat protein